MSDEGHARKPGDDVSKAVPGSFQHRSEQGLDDLLRMLWRRKMVVLGTLVTLTTIVTITVFQLTPRYTATASIMIEPRETRVVDVEAVMSGLPQDLATILSEIEVIKSRGLAERVIRQLNLLEDPEFNEHLRPPGILRRLFDSDANFAKQWIEIIFRRANDRALTEAEQLDKERVDVIDEFLERLGVKPVTRSRIITVDFESERPGMAASVANTLADLYLVEQLEARFETTQRATEWLSERLASLQQKVSVSEKAVEAYRRKAGLIKGERATLVSEQISVLNTEFVLARSKRAEAEVRLSQAEVLLATEGGVNSVGEVLSSRLIQRLREQEAVVVRKAAELSMEYGEKHPRMINVRAEIRDLRAKIQGEVGKIIENLRSEVTIAHTREESLETSLRALEGRIADLNEKEVYLRELEREANATRVLYETFLSRFKETSEQQELEQTDARIISRADVPAKPSFPQKKLIIALALLGSSMLGVFLAFGIERLDHGFRSMEQVEAMTGVPALGLVPAVRRFRMAPQHYLVEQPASAFGESIRSVHTGLILSNVDKPPKIVLIASSVPEEAKTVIAVSLARSLALSGHKAIVVDADLRRPGVHVKLDVSGKPGLVQLLAGEASLDEVVQTDEATGMSILPAGGTTPNAADLLRSAQMKNLLAKLSADYELVVIDSPPVLAVADARNLAHLADKTIFLIRWAETRREVAMTGLKQIENAGGDLAGVVLTNVNVKKHARYGYGDSGYYYGRNRKYYVS